MSLVTLVVRDYDEAIRFYVDGLGFTLVEDTPQGNKRWVVVSAGDGAALLLAEATTDQQSARVGDQTGGRVGFFLNTDDFDRDHARMTEFGVHFLETPREEVYGKVAVFEDLYGNRWDLLEPARA
jgi:catechol 2,3-dioxygenase-like lactoylglutathione lyase family enzyme